jgi:hypothetical protein
MFLRLQIATLLVPTSSSANLVAGVDLDMEGNILSVEGRDWLGGEYSVSRGTRLVRRKILCQLRDAIGWEGNILSVEGHNWLGASLR